MTLGRMPAGGGGVAHQNSMASSTGTRKEELKTSEAYIHDAFEPLAMSRLQKQKLAKKQERQATIMPSHLLFDISKTQVASLIARSQPRARVPRRDATGNIGTRKTEAQDKFIPSASAPSTNKLSPISTSTKERLRRLTTPDTTTQTLRQSATMPVVLRRAATPETQLKTSMSVSPEPEEALLRPSTAMAFSELQKMDDLAQKRKKALARASAFRPTMITNMSVAELGGEDGSTIAQDATKLYASECYQTNGASIPARHRVLPHVMVESSHQRAFSTLSVLRKNDFITKSPAHTKGMTISQRGYVEVHDKGFTEFSSMQDLSTDLSSYTLMRKLPIVLHFREYKIFRNWEMMVRQRKFAHKVARLEKLMLQSHKGLWDSVMMVQSECVSLVADMKDKDLRPPSSGFTMDAFSKELHRRKDILQESLEVTRQKIAEQLDKYFASVSTEVQLVRLRAVFKHNRDNDPEAAGSKASEDMILLCRLHVLAEHILNQTAIAIHNEELARVCRMFDVDMLGSIQADCFMHLDENAEVSLDLPYTKAQTEMYSENVRLMLIPDGKTLLDVIGKELSFIYSSLAYTIRPRLVAKLDQYIAPEVLEKYIVKKPDYLHCLTNSRLYIAGHAHLNKVVTVSENSALKHMRGFNKFRSIFAYIETHCAREAMGLAPDPKTFDNFHERAEQYSQWHVELSKVMVSDQEIGSFRVKGRRIKMYMQEKLQGIIDSQFDSFNHHVMMFITNLKLEGSRFAKKLDTPITSFQTLADVLPFVLDLGPKIDQYEQSMAKAVKMRETLQHHWALTTRSSTPDAKISLPAFNASHCDMIRYQHSVAMKRMENQKESHKELVKNAAEDFFRQAKNFNGILHSPKLNNIKEDPAKIQGHLEDGAKHLADLRSRAAGFREVLEHLKMPLLNLSAIETAERTLVGLQKIWACVADFRQFSRFVMETPLKELRHADNLHITMPVLLESIRGLLESYHDMQVLRDLKFQYEELHYLWPAIEKLTDKKMNKAHYDELLYVEGTLAFHDFSRLTITDCMARGAFKTASKLSRIHAQALRENQTYGVLERLKASMQAMTIRVCRERTYVWLDGLELQAAQVQDHVLVASHIKQSPFVDLVARDIQEIGQSNSEASFISTKLKYSHDAWKKARVLLRRHDLLDKAVVQSVEIAESKWLSCIATLSEGRDLIKVSKFDFQANLHVRETVEHWEKTEQFFGHVAAQLRAEFAPLLFLSDDDTLLLCSYFLGPGPPVPPHLLAECFPNVYSVEFSFDHTRPKTVFGAHGEQLQVDIPDKLANNNPTSRMYGLMSALPASLWREFREAIKTVPGDGTAEEFVEWGRGYVAQCVCLALLVTWTELFVDSMKESPQSANVDTASNVDAYAGILGEGLHSEGGAASELDRKKASAALLHAFNWREALLADDGSVLRDIDPDYARRQTTSTADHEKRKYPWPLGLPAYALSPDGISLNVEVGPLSLEYGFQFLDGTETVAMTPQTGRFVLHTISSFLAGTCGMLLGACNSGRTEMVKEAGRICGRYVKVVDCSHGVDALRLARIVEGVRKTGGWLAVKGTHCLDAGELGSLAWSMRDVMGAYRKKVASGKLVSPYERPGMFIISNDDFVFAREVVVLPTDLQEATRPCVLANVDRRAVCEAFLCAEGFEGWGPAGSRLETALGLLGIGVADHEGWISGVGAVKAIVREAGRLKRLKAVLRSRVERGVDAEQEGALIESMDTKDEDEGEGKLFETPADDGDQNEDSESAAQLGAFLQDESTRSEQRDKDMGQVEQIKFDFLRDDRDDASEAAESDPGRFERVEDSTDACVAAAFLRYARSSLSDSSFKHALLVSRFAWGDVVPHVEELQPAPEKDLEQKVAAVMLSKKMAYTRQFLARCTAVNYGLHSSFPLKPLILAGPPRSGKTTCIGIMKRARIIDLDDPFRDPLPEAAVKTVTPMAFFSVERPNGELYDKGSAELLRDYVNWFTSSELKDDFLYRERWLVLDCTEVREMDAWVAQRYGANGHADGGHKSAASASIIVETCSIEHAVPGLLSACTTVPFGPQCVGWEAVFSSWRLGPGALLESRNIKELDRLAKTHIPHIETYIAKNCRRIAFQPEAATAQSFLSILHYYFFLGATRPSRRTIGFTRSAFVFAIAWSWGVLLTQDDRRQFDRWFQDRMRRAGITSLEGKSTGPWNTIWDYYLSLENMDLVLFSSTQDAFIKETQAHTQGLGSVLVPTKEMRAAHMMLGMHRMRGLHTLIIGHAGSGKSLFHEWRRFRTKIPDQKIPTSLALTSSMTSKSLAKWLADASDAVPDEHKQDFYNQKGATVLVLIDDVHVAMDAEGISHKGMGPMAELLRHVLDHRGLIKEGFVEEDRSLDNLTLALSCEDSWLLTRTARTHTPVHTHARLLAHVAPILLGPMSKESLSSIVCHSPFSAPNVSGPLQLVLDRLPPSFVGVHEWVLGNVRPVIGDEGLLFWDMEHVRMLTTAISWLNIAKMKTPEKCIRFCWHEMMRAYSDRLMRFEQVEDVRKNIRNVFTKLIGITHIRHVRQASESRMFFALMPAQNAQGAAAGSTQPSAHRKSSAAWRQLKTLADSRKAWEMLELSPEELVSRARICLAEEYGLAVFATRDVCSIANFPRHLAHALHAIRPSGRAHGCMLAGPAGSGRKGVVRCAAAMVGCKVVLLDGMGAVEAIENVESAVRASVYVVFLLSANRGLLQDVHFGGLLNRLCRLQGLDSEEQVGVGGVRFGILVDVDVLSPAGDGTVLPMHLRGLLRFFTVDWYEGWSDEALARSIDYAGINQLGIMGMLTLPPPSEQDAYEELEEETGDMEPPDDDHDMARGRGLMYAQQKKPGSTLNSVRNQNLYTNNPDGLMWRATHAEALFRVHRCVEEAFPDVLEAQNEGGSDSFPPPQLAARFAQMFAKSLALRGNALKERLQRLERACVMYGDVKKHAEWLEQQHAQLMPKMEQSVKTQLKWRDDTLHFGSVASRARRMAEEDVIDGVMEVLYGDAPGADIQKEHKESVRHYQSACEAVTNLKEVHFIQLEMCDSHVELLKLLWESLCICLGEEVSDEGIKRLRVESCQLPDKVSRTDINRVQLQTINTLRRYTSNPMFVPEKMFSVNRAAGTLCGWARCFERCARAIEWLRPDSQSNINQSLDRVRATSKAQLMALKQIEEGVETAKQRHKQALQDEKSARAEMSHLQKQIRECRRILNGLNGDHVRWQAEVARCRSFTSTETGDTVLACAYAVYLGALPYEKRKKAVGALKVAAEGDRATDGDPIRCSDNFSLEAYCEADTALRNWEACGLSQEACTRDNATCVCVISMGGLIPLLIDPWMNGTAWLKRMHGDTLVCFSAGPPLEKKTKKSPAAHPAKSPIVLSHETSSPGTGPPATPESLRPASTYGAYFDVSEPSSGPTTSDAQELESTLRRARASNLPVLIEDCDVVLPVLMHVLDLAPELAPQPIKEALVGEDAFVKQGGEGYKIYLSTQVRRYFPPASALERVAVVNWEGSEDATESVFMDVVLFCVEPAMWETRQDYIDSSVRLKQAVRRHQAQALHLLCAEPVLDEMKGGRGQKYVELCNELDAAKQADQDHIIHTSECLRRIESYRGLASAIARLMRAAERVSGMAGLQAFSNHSMIKVLETAVQGTNMGKFQYGTLSFRTALEAVSVKAVRACVCLLRAGLSETFADIIRVWITSYLREGYTVPEVLEHTAVSMQNRRLGGDEQKGVMTPAGWRGLQGYKEVLGNLYEQLMFHVDQSEWDWSMWASRVVPEQGFELPFLPKTPMDLQSRLVITVCVQPAKLPAALHQLASGVDEGDVSLHDRMSALASHEPGEPIFLITCTNACAVNKMVSIALHKHAQKIPAQEGMTPDMFRIIQSCGTAPGAGANEAAIKVLEKAVNSGGWVCVIVPTWRDRLCWIRKTKSLLTSRRANRRFRLFFHVPRKDPALLSACCGPMSSGTLVNCSNPSEVNLLLSACVADCFQRGVGTADGAWGERGAKFFWRAVLGLCFMHAVIAKEQANIDSIAFPGVRRVSLPQLLQCVRFISVCNMDAGGWRGALASARAVMQHVCYTDIFARCSCGSSLFHAAMSKGLYTSRSQVEIFGLVLQSPDTQIPKTHKDAYSWAALHKYAIDLDAALPAAFHPPLLFQLDNANAISAGLMTALRRGLPRQVLAADEDEHGKSVARRAVMLTRSLYSKLPTSLGTKFGIMSLYGVEGDEALRKHVITTQTEIDRLFGSVLMKEVEGANRWLQRVGEDLGMLNGALDGTRFFCRHARAIYANIVEDRVPLSWDAVAHRRKQSLRAWLEQLRVRINYLTNRLQDDKLGNARRMKAPGMLVPLKSFAHPKMILQAHVAALCLSSPGLSPHQVCFCAFQIPSIKAISQPHPERGLYVEGLMFRCGVWNPKVGVLDDPQIGDVSLSQPASVWLRPIPLSELPGRARMKSQRQHWSEIPLYAEHPCSTDLHDLGDPLCTIFVRTLYRGVTVHERGVCALLNDAKMIDC